METIILIFIIISLSLVIIENMLSILFIEWYFIKGPKIQLLTENLNTKFIERINNKGKLNFQIGSAKILKNKNGFCLRENFGGKNIGRVPTFFFIGYVKIVKPNIEYESTLFLKILIGPFLLFLILVFYIFKELFSLNNPILLTFCFILLIIYTISRIISSKKNLIKLYYYFKDYFIENRL